MGYSSVCRDRKSQLLGLGLMKLDFRIPTFTHLSSPKGLRAESAGAVTGRWCPHSGEGEDFLMGQLIFFTKTTVTPERKVEK